MQSPRSVPLAICCGAVWLATLPAAAEDVFELEPILYSTARPDDVVARLGRRLEKGKLEFDYKASHGYLHALLDELDISPTSQVLVFSKTSFQPSRISPQTPRAVYFNDEAYVGWLQNSDTLEISVADADLGTNFYTLSREAKEPRLVRQTHQCLQCHASSQTHQIPGHIVRSIYPGKDGMPIFRAGTFRTDQKSPLSERWGGWYVSGSHGAQRHMGNAILADPDDPQALDVESGANLRDLSTRFDTAPYLTGHSDIVALLVLEHQTEMHNRITAASFETRRALHQQSEMNRLFEESDDYRSETTRSRIRNSCRRLLKYMLFSEETALTDTIRGTSGFSEVFAARGPFDDQQRSLRQFDLERRLFKYPCSYLIYSPTFNALPPEALEEIYRQLHDLLTAKDPDPDQDFAHLTPADRKAILDILVATKPNLPAYWKTAP